ncbi:hypothetical protein G9C98_007306, partial [Cotesia typhae]
PIQLFAQVAVMKIILTLVSLLALTRAGVLPKPFQGRIVNGNNAQLGEIPYQNPQSIHEVIKVIVHERYNPSDSWRNDIALLKVKEVFIESEVVSFVPLPSPNQEVPSNSVAVVSGWGRLMEGGNTPTILQKTTIVIADQDYCEQKYGWHNLNIYESHICAYDPIEESGSCHGDSGGPLTVDGKLTGLVSWAMGCASTEYPTVYTRVSEYIYWINANAL